MSRTRSACSSTSSSTASLFISPRAMAVSSVGFVSMAMRANCTAAWVLNEESHKHFTSISLRSRNASRFREPRLSGAWRRQATAAGRNAPRSFSTSSRKSLLACAGDPSTDCDNICSNSFTAHQIGPSSGRLYTSQQRHFLAARQFPVSCFDKVDPHNQQFKIGISIALWAAMLDGLSDRIERYLDILSARQRQVAANIANADTPGY